MAELAEAAAQDTVDPDPRPALLAGCMQALQTRARKVIEMKYQNGLPIREIARQLGFQVGAIEMALVRARRALKECIERKMGGSPDLQARR